MTKSAIRESRIRVALSRVLSVTAVALLYRTPDAIAFGALLAGILIYYIPKTAAAPYDPPKWIRITWTLASLSVVGAYFATNIKPPPGSIVPPVLGYGLLLLLAVQILWDVVRNKLLNDSTLNANKG